jgi:predicted HicB family RNase H-like nuclease
MSTKPKPTLTKPQPVDASKVLAFAEAGGQQKRDEATTTTRLNANIPIELHKALKVRAANEGTTIGALIEDWIRSWKT